MTPDPCVVSKLEKLQVISTRRILEALIAKAEHESAPKPKRAGWLARLAREERQ